MKKLVLSNMLQAALLVFLLEAGCREPDMEHCPSISGGLVVSMLSLRLVTETLSRDMAPTRRQVLGKARQAVQQTIGMMLKDNGAAKNCHGTWALSLAVEFRHSSSLRKGRATVLIAVQLRKIGTRDKPWDYQVVGDKLYDLKHGVLPRELLLETFRKTLQDILRYPATRLRLQQADDSLVAEAIPAGSLESKDILVAHMARESTCTLSSASGIIAPKLTATAQALCPAVSTALVYPRSDFEQDVTDMAVREAGRRHLKTAVRALLAILDSPVRAETQSAALDAIVAIADPASVDALVKLAEHKEAEDLARIVEAVGRIGGPKAEDFLRFLKDGSEDETIRNMAAATLKELHRRNSR